MLKKLVLAALFVLLIVPAAQSQVSYQDVAVIVNVNSSASQTVGSYFKARRNIPNVNMIYVSADTTEEIDSTRFNSLRAQVENHLVLNNLRDSINYIVTTKGVPLKVNRGNTFSTQSPSSSVESELMLILGSYSSYIGGAGPRRSPYYNVNARFSRAQYRLYLTTRLDAYSVEGVLDLIDRSGPNVPVPVSSGFVLDLDPSWDSELNLFLSWANTSLLNKGRNVVFDSSTVYTTHQQNLLGYASWGSNDRYQHLYTQNAIPHNTYVPGALAETFVSTSGRTFSSPPVYGQSLIADLIAEGVTGVKGYVYEPYSAAIAKAHILFDRYVSNYNLAESYFMASQQLSWMDVVVGDPKTSIAFTDAPNPVQLAGFSGFVMPQTNAVRFNWRTVSETNNYGFILQRSENRSSGYVDIENSFVAGHGTTTMPQEYTWTYANAPRGTWYYRLKQIDLDGTQHFSEPIIVTNDVVAAIHDKADVQDFVLGQNYPNPFNPTTTIRFSIPSEGQVSLKVYDVTGKEVATVVDEFLSQGSYEREFRAEKLASGMYIYRLQSGALTESRRLAITK